MTDSRAMPAVVRVEVAMKQIAAMYDLPHGNKLIGPEDDPKIILHGMSIAGSLGPLHQLEFTDEYGKAIREDTDSELPGMYQTVRVSGYAPFDRTFSRSQAVDIDGKYVYVWAADSKSGEGMRLVHELFFEGGKFGFVDLTSENNEGKDTRTPGRARHETLHLDVVDVQKRTRRFYFFFLAPFQLPWAAIDSLRETVAHRGSRLYDEFWTDFFEDGDPSTARPIFELLQESLQGKQIGYQVYLVDALDEAARRHARYVEALEMWNECQNALAQDRTYLLAKRVDGFARAHPELYEHIQNDLPTFLYEKEKDSFRLMFTAGMLASNLLRWIGECIKREPIGGRDTWYSDGRTRMAFKERKEEGEWYSPFSQLVNEYRRFGSDDQWVVVGERVALACSRLGETRAGQKWMLYILGRAMDGELPMGDGGAGFLFETRRKAHKTSLSVVGGLLQEFGPTWTVKYRKNALSSLSEWFKTTHGVPLEAYTPRRVRRVKKSLARRALKKAHKRGIKHLRIEPSSVTALKATEEAMNRIAFAIEIVNLANAVEQAADSDDGWDMVRAFSATLDAYSAAMEISSKIPQTVTVVTSTGKKVIKVAPIISVASSTIDTVLAAQDTYQATNFGEQMGHALRTIGFMAAIGGTLAAKTGVGIIVLIVGYALQAVGAWVVSNFTAAGLFLQYCRWGTPTWTAKRATAISDANDFGYAGDLDDLAGDIEAQHQALDELIYDFEPELSLTEHESVVIGASLYVRMNIPKHLIGPEATWDIRIKYRKPGQSDRVEEFRFTPDEYMEHLDVSLNEEVTVVTFAPEDDETADAWERATGKVEGWGTVKLDVLGDGTKVVEREVEKDEFRMTYF